MSRVYREYMSSNSVLKVAATKILARQLVRLRKQIANLQGSRAQMRGIATHTQAMHAQSSVASGLKGATKAMSAMNKQMAPAKQMKILQDFQRQSAQMDMTTEMMSDAIDDASDNDEAEEETDELTNQKVGFATTPFTRQENTIVQTCAVACYSVAVAGGGLNRKTYEQAGVDTEGNVPNSHKEPGVGWMTGFLFVSSFVGLLALVPLRKIVNVPEKGARKHPRGDNIQISDIGKFMDHDSMSLSGCRVQHFRLRTQTKHNC